ncbi:protein ENHANCED DOWNY MILDEW 2-like [Salvia miltiorrhiza]|uniref:protein ENHANCED DOWNY MILDEW 2-like n=1 Tax=Salvia miltiorrhiza TaxID=226208 RepID=UPI0025AB7760|nr:protein ENHANCED DOWNY MILDEW 2-like [Salvia miltiorrhiza]
MASSDDEGDIVTTNVSDYEFTCGVDDESISFAKLPVVWSEGSTHDGKQLQIYLRGKTDKGLRTIYVQVTAWKFNLLKGKPEISVLSAQGNWIKLLKPWKPYHDIIRTVGVTLHVLHFAKWNPQRSQKALWDNLKDTFSMFERRPCVDDLADHVPLITEAIKRDTELEKSKLLSAFLAEKPWERKTFSEDVRPPFIVDNVNDKEDQGECEKKADESEDSESEEGDKADENDDSDSDESDCFDSVCAICDNGGNLYICDGKCMRSFHATVEDGEESKCVSLGLTDAELEAIKNVPFICDNCKYKKHQCFACGELGSSDELSNPEVFCCVNGACGYFYHPRCVATLLHPGDDAATEELEKRIADGEPFACPIHKCDVCKELEVRSTDKMQFAVCRRCPKAYHRKCLPRDIRSEEDPDNEIVQRGWEGLIPKRLLIYCLAHDVDEEMLTPLRNHIVFPGPRQEKKKRLELETNKNKYLAKERGLAFKNNAGNKISGKQQKGNGGKGVDLSRKRLEELPTPSSKKQKLANTRNSRRQFKRSTNDEGEVSSDDGVPEPLNPQSVTTGHAENEITKKVKPTAKRTDNTFTLDADARRRVLTLMKDASSSVTLQEVKKRHKPPSQTLYSKFSTENVTLGKVEGSVQAVHAALKKLDEGSVRDAKAVCGNELLQQVLKWKEKLKVYLAPFLHGMRYTSFGRHFTKMDKLEEIADILRWYVQDGDMLVDFCCGSNDFSCLMKNKLDEMGRICSFKNYDILQAKNDFNFERRDWMGVKKEELPDGSKLIMGLNPPFGVNAALANRFINKALEFKPKLLILIVPRETQRLDEKKPPYDLIWEDDQILAGKSFYLPGSVDVNDKQIEDWNNTAPVLYLWSRRAWTPKHKAIAKKHSHQSGALKNCRLDTNHNELHTTNSAQAFDSKGEDEHADTTKNLQQKSKEIISHREGLDKETISHREGLPQKESMSHGDGLPCNINSNEVGKSHAAAKNHSESSPKSFGGKGKKQRSPSNTLLKDESSSKFSVPRHLSPDNHLQLYPTEHRETPSLVRSERDEHHQVAQVPWERGDYRQIRQVAERDEHRQVAQVPCERGGYEQQLSQGNLPTRRSNSRSENSGGVSDLLKKYGAEELQRDMSIEQAYSAQHPPQHGMSGEQAYRAQHPPQLGMSGGQVYDAYRPQREYDWGSNQEYASPAATGRFIGSPPLHTSYSEEMNVVVHGRGRVEPNEWNQERAVPSYQGRGSGYSHHYGLAAAPSSYGEMRTPVAQRYAARLHEPHHARMGPTLQHPPPHPPQNQGSIGFAQGPYVPHHTNSGWIRD